MTMPALVLCPDDPQWMPPDDKHLDHFLQSIRLTGKALDQQGHYLAGDRFLELIAFMGCSPDINLEPGKDSRSFCHIALYTPTDAIEFHCGKQPHTPRCPVCRSPVEDWQERIESWREDQAASLWECANCHRRLAPWHYNWRKSAGFGRCFIEIRNIHPQEVIPQQQLLDTLHAQYRINWHYFYQN